MNKLWVLLTSIYSSCSKFKNNQLGVALIWIVVAVPVLFWGVEYVRKNYIKDQFKKDAAVAYLEKRCSPDAALAAAKNWNPALTLGEQRDSMLRIIANIYNVNPSYYTSLFGQAVPGIITRDDKEASLDLKPSSKVIPINSSTATMQMHSVNSGISGNNLLWNGVDVILDKCKHIGSTIDNVEKYKVYDEVSLYKNVYKTVYQDLFTDPHPETVSTNSTAVSYSIPYSADIEDCSLNQAGYRSNSTTTLNSFNYTTVDNSDEYVDISIENDSIKVRTDNQASTAVPAKCNVNIVLAIPTNAASCNSNNLDINTIVSGKPYESTNRSAVQIPDEVMQTPIYQMGQACKNFVKDNFYHVRGVNMALIPYSGKVSLSPARSGWTKSFSPFNSDQVPVETPFMVGACLYATKGVKNSKLNAGSSGWGGGIMFRGGSLQQDKSCGYAPFYTGSLTSNANPSSSRYMQMPYNPCTVANISLLKRECIENCERYSPNPYYIIELTADMRKIYEMCNLLYPFYDKYNVSNFLFIPLEWARNIFSSWSKDPGGLQAEGGEGDNARLSLDSKNRDHKNVVVLLVNKANWFEPKELTYLGFDNDYSEFPMIDGDKLDFDGVTGMPTSYKKILVGEVNSGEVKKSGFCENARITFTFPYKCLLMLKVRSPTKSDAQLNEYDIRSLQSPHNKSATIQFTSGVINSSSELVDTAKHTFNGEMVFTAEKNQMSPSTNCRITVEVTNLVFESIEISNRPYKKEGSEEPEEPDLLGDVGGGGGGVDTSLAPPAASNATPLIKPKNVTYDDLDFITYPQTGPTLSFGYKIVTEYPAQEVIYTENMALGSDSTERKDSKGQLVLKYHKDTKTERTVHQPGVTAVSNTHKSVSIEQSNLVKQEVIVIEDKEITGLEKGQSVSVTGNFGDYEVRWQGTDSGRWRVTAPAEIEHLGFVPKSNDGHLNVQKEYNSSKYIEVGATPFVVRYSYENGKDVKDYMDFYDSTLMNKLYLHKQNGYDLIQVNIRCTRDVVYLLAPPANTTVYLEVKKYHNRFAKGIVVLKKGTGTYRYTVTSLTPTIYSYVTDREGEICLYNAELNEAYYKADKTITESGGTIRYCENFTEAMNEGNTKKNLDITVQGSGTLRIVSGYNGNTVYNCSGETTITLQGELLTGTYLRYEFSEGMYTKNIKLDYDHKYKINTIKSTKNNNVLYTTAENTNIAPISETYKTITSWDDIDSNGICWGDPYYKNIANKYEKIGYYAVGVGNNMVTESVYDIIDYTNKNSATLIDGLNGIISTNVRGHSSRSDIYELKSSTEVIIKTKYKGGLLICAAPSLDSKTGTIASKTIDKKTKIEVSSSALEECSEGYKFTFRCQNVTLMWVKFVNWEPDIFEPLPIPGGSTANGGDCKTSIVDFSKQVGNVPSYNSALVQISNSSNTSWGSMDASIQYDGELKYWCGSGGLQIIDMQYYSKNDSYMVWEYISSSRSSNTISYRANQNDLNYSERRDDQNINANIMAYMPGLTQHRFDYLQSWPYVRYKPGGRVKYIYGGNTRPLNAALYAYNKQAGGYSVKQSVDDASDFNRNVMQNLTRDLCLKLKQENVKVYVVKYRAQSSRKSVQRPNNPNGKLVEISLGQRYDEFSQCGASVFSADGEESLKDTLDEIAKDIKKFANYQPAQIFMQ